MQPLICNILIARPIEQGVAKKSYIYLQYRGAAENFKQVRPPYCWQLGGASSLSAPRSIPQNQGKTEVLPVLPMTAPLDYVHYRLTYLYLGLGTIQVLRH